MPFGPGVFRAVTLTNPTAIASASLLHCGFGAQTNASRVTAGDSGRLLIVLNGDLVADATARILTCVLAYGTGTAPANAAAATGTTVGGTLSWTSLTGQVTKPFALHSLVTGLTPGTSYWIDLQLAASAGTGQPTNLNFVAVEF